MQQLDSITNIIVRCVDEAKEDNSLVIDQTTVLFGDGAFLDSLGLVHLILAVEEEIEEQLGVGLTIASDKAFSSKRSPFRTVSTFAEYVSELVSEV